MSIFDFGVKQRVQRIRNGVDALGVYLKSERQSCGSVGARADTDYLLEEIRLQLLALLDETPIVHPPATTVACAVSKDAISENL